jgi:hypothetical protein
MTLHEWIELAPVLIGIAGAVWGWMQRRWRLPKVAVWAMKELKRIGFDAYGITLLLKKASGLADLDNAGRQRWVREHLQSMAQANGFELTDATANLIIEWAYSRLKGKLKWHW